MDGREVSGRKLRSHTAGGAILLSWLAGTDSQLARPRSLIRSGFTRSTKIPTSRDLSSVVLGSWEKRGELCASANGVFGTASSQPSLPAVFRRRYRTVKRTSWSREPSALRSSTRHSPADSLLILIRLYVR